MSDTSAAMMGTKIEVHLHKAEPGSWASLYIPRPAKTERKEAEEAPEEAPIQTVDALDLDDLDLTPQKMVLSTEASGGKTDAPVL